MQLDAFCRRRYRTRIEYHVNAGLFHLGTGELAQCRAHFGQNLIAAVYQRHSDVARTEAAVESCAGLDQVIDLARCLDAGKTAADHHEREIPPSPIWVVADSGLVQLVHQMTSQRNGAA